MNADGTLVARVSQHVADLLASLTEDQLVALADGRLVLAIAVPPRLASDLTPSALAVIPPSTLVPAPQPSAAPSDTTSSLSGGQPPAVPEASTPSRKQTATRSTARRTSANRGTANTKPEPAEVAERLRGMETEQEGAEYLNSVKLTVDALRRVAAHLGLTLRRERRDEVVRKVLNQAIGARRKYAGLRQW